MSIKERFKDKVVIVTGASSGIGKDSAIKFAGEGAKVALVSRSKEKLEAVANEIRQFNQDVLVIPTDVSSREQVKNAVNKTTEKFGRIDVLFNNAGSSEVGLVEDDDFVEKVKKMFEVDYLGSVYFTKEVLPVMINTVQHCFSD